MNLSTFAPLDDACRPSVPRLGFGSVAWVPALFGASGASVNVA